MVKQGGQLVAQRPGQLCGCVSVEFLRVRDVASSAARTPGVARPLKRWASLVRTGARWEERRIVTVW